MKAQATLGCLLMLLLLSASTSKLFASACAADVEALCSFEQPGLGTIGRCLEDKKEQVSYGCRQWMTKMDRSLKKLRESCSWVARDLCQDVKPGYGRVKGCLMANFDKLPADCQNALNEVNQ